MTYLDTNVILRWMLDDDRLLSPRARRIIDESEPAEFLVTDVTLSEIFYVLRGKGYNRQQTAEYMYGLLEQPAFIFDQESRLNQLIALIRDTNLDFADCYLICRALHSGASLKTFDKAMLKAYDKYKAAATN